MFRGRQSSMFIDLVDVLSIDKMVWTNWYLNKWYGQNGIGQNGIGQNGIGQNGI